MSGRPKVSVVIPAYNAEAFIERTLDSVKAQTYASYEVVLIDDGSSDKTQQIVEEYFQRHRMPGVCIKQANKKIAGARNTGLKAAKGEFIALLDHDDLWYPQKLAVVMGEFARFPEVDLVCHDENVTKNGRKIRTLHYGPAVPRMYEKLLFEGNALSPSASTFRRQKALEIGGFDENLDFNTVEDYDFWMRLSKIGKFHFIDQVLGEYQVVERAASRQVEYHHRNAETLIRKHLSAYFREPGLLARLRARKRVSKIYRSALWQLLQHQESPKMQREYLLRMLREFPFESKNVAVSVLWAVRTLRDAI